MEEYFKEIVDVNFTAGMEDKLDDVEIKDLEWKKIIRDFYGPFEKELEVADHAIEKVTVEDQPTGETCELCGKPMVLKQGALENLSPAPDIRSARIRNQL